MAMVKLAMRKAESGAVLRYRAGMSRQAQVALYAGAIVSRSSRITPKESTPRER